MFRAHGSLKFLCISNATSTLHFKLMSLSFRVKKLKNTPIYVKPQFTSDSGTCRISVLVGIRSDPGKTIDSITVQFRLPPCVLSSDLSSNYGAVNVLADKVLIPMHQSIQMILILL